MEGRGRRGNIAVKLIDVVVHHFFKKKFKFTRSSYD